MKKRRLAVWAALVLALVLPSFVLGYVARRNEWIRYSTRQKVKTFFTGGARNADHETINTGDGNWSKLKPIPESQSAIRQDEIDGITALGYLDAYEKPMTGETGVVYTDPQRCFDGYRLYTSGHKPEARLITAGGATLHTWSIEYSDVFPDIPPHRSYVGRFRRVHVYPDGQLLAIFDMAGTFKLNADSGIVWTHEGKSHHDFQVQPDGSIYVIDAEIQAVPEHREAIIDYITHLSAEGKVLSRVSLYECFKQSDYAALISHAAEGHDIMHTNTVHVLSKEEKESLRDILTGPGRGGHIESTLALVSMRSMDTVAMVDLDAKTVVWAMTGMWKAQHEPVITERGTILVFDNRSMSGASRIVELDPVTQAIVWDYAGGPDTPFSSPVGGAIHLMPNGNLLVVETTRGRAFELTRDKTIVWEFRSPHRVQKEEELVANLYDMTPVPTGSIEFIGVTESGGPAR